MSDETPTPTTPAPVPASEEKKKERDTLHEARLWLRERFEEGSICPCCKQNVKLYQRDIDGAMARALVELHHQDRARPGEWVHTPKLIDRLCPSRMTPLLRYWGLVEQRPGERNDGSKRIGYYRITQLGHDFVEGTTRVPKYKYIYNQNSLSDAALLEVLGRLPSSETTSIEEALGKKFNYRELMQRPQQDRPPGI